ncbi:MAG: hypothetical protein ACR5LG_02835 [Sodalis sp. (in: enterobacteria)]|uniref:hypothetical protein n=1 Tax=Sodalis sp. (in: enterobacteria) TaxID=1898979 RepID=UPI003F3F95C4
MWRVFLRTIKLAYLRWRKKCGGQTRPIDFLRCGGMMRAISSLRLRFPYHVRLFSPGAVIARGAFVIDDFLLGGKHFWTRRKKMSEK